jgi:hypothetical protein
MGGEGSGRQCWSGTPKKLVEDCVALDLIAFKKAGYLKPYTTGTTSRGNQTFRWAINEDSHGFNINTQFSVTNSNGTHTPYAFSIRCKTTSLASGGLRWWLVCPNCKSLRGMLYLHPVAVGRGFQCRECHNLVYAKTRESSLYKNPFYKLSMAMLKGDFEKVERMEAWMLQAGITDYF